MAKGAGGEGVLVLGRPRGSLRRFGQEGEAPGDLGGAVVGDVLVTHGREGFDFLGCHFRARMSGRLWEQKRVIRYYLHRWPSQRAMKRLREKVRDRTGARRKGTRGVRVIDWENRGPADPSQELGCVLFEFARSDPGRARALINAYRDAGGPATVNRRGHFSMLIAQLGHITEMAATDWLQPNPRSPDRADSAAWIGEVLDEPHTRALLESLLVAVRSGGGTP